MDSFSTNERWLYSYFPSLSTMMQDIRNTCPYDNGMFKILYQYNNVINTPCLILMSHYIHSIALSYSKILFTVRDTCYLYLIYKKLFPDDNIDLLFTNRHMYLNPTTEFDSYINKIIDQKTLVIDMNGSGKSFDYYFKTHLNNHNVTILFFAKLLECSDILEFINYVRFGTVCSIDLIGKPSFCELEYPTYLVYPIEKNINNILDYIDKNDMTKVSWDNTLIIDKLKQYMKINKNPIINFISEKYHNSDYIISKVCGYESYLEFKDIFEKNKYPSQRPIKDIQIYIMHVKNEKYALRKTHMIELLKTLGLSNYIFIEPFLPTKETRELLAKFLDCDVNKIDKSLTRASHSLTYYSILDKSDKEFILLEDDIEILNSVQDTKIVLEFIINYYPKDSDMIYLEYCFENCCSTNKQVYRRVKNPLCLAGVYYPSKIGRQNILNEIRNFYSSEKHDATDWSFYHTIKNGNVIAYEQQLLFYQDKKFGSHIEGSNKNQYPLCDQEHIDLLKPLIPLWKNIPYTYSKTVGKTSKYNAISFVVFIFILLIFILLIYKKKYIAILIVSLCLILIMVIKYFIKNPKLPKLPKLPDIYISNFLKIAKELYESELLTYESPYKLYSGWEEYRLGDMIRFKYHRKEGETEKAHHKNYPNSIASEYMRQTTDENRLDILFNIIKKRPQHKPPSDALIIHLRIGDVIMPEDTILDILTKKKEYNYIKQLPEFYNIIKKINNIPNIKTIILVFGSHKENIDLKKSSLYINCIRKFFEYFGYNVKLRLGSNPDEDFIYMSSADYFSPAGGGYSDFIRKMVEMNNKNII